MELNQDEISRFFSKIKKLDSGCWEWIGGKYVTGYGMFCARRGKRKTFSAHRISWIIHNKSEIPEKLMICHTCDNRICVNPEHLYAGTGYDNNRDTVIRNRGNRKIGSSCSWAKVNEDDVRRIRQLRLDGLTIQKIADMYKLDYHATWDILHYKNWKHVS